MNKLKKYLKENYKRILLVVLIIVGYIGLLFACKYANNDIKENVPTIQDNRKRAMQDNNEYYTTDEQQNLFSFNGYIIDEFVADFQHEDDYEFYIDEAIDESYGIGTYFCIGLNYTSYDYQEFDTEDTEISFSLYNSNENYLNNLDDDKYYYIYTDFEVVPMTDDYASPEFYQVYSFNIQCDSKYLFNKYQYINPIFKGSFLKDNLQFLYCEFDLYFTNRYEYTNFYLRLFLSIFDLSDFTDLFYNNGSSDGYDEGYYDGYIDGDRQGYDNGYNDGIGTATDINYNSSVFKNYNQFTMNYNQYSIVYDVSNRNINEFPYTFNPTLNGLDTGNLYNDIVDLVGESSGYNFTLTSNYSTLGVGGIKWSTYQSGGNSPVQQINLLDNNNNIIVSFDEQYFTFDNHFYYTFDIPNEYQNYNCKFQFLIYINYLPSPPWMISLISNGTFESGLQQGIEQGKQNVLNNLGQYDLYTKEQYLNYGESQKEIGIDIGQTRGCSVNNLFFAIADIPTRILSSLLSFELFGINMFVAFGSIATLLLIIWVIRKVK